MAHGSTSAYATSLRPYLRTGLTHPSADKTAECFALADTGCQLSTIDAGVLRKLGLFDEIIEAPGYAAMECANYGLMEVLGQIDLIVEFSHMEFPHKRMQFYLRFLVVEADKMSRPVILGANLLQDPDYKQFENCTRIWFEPNWEKYLVKGPDQMPVAIICEKDIAEADFWKIDYIVDLT